MAAAEENRRIHPRVELTCPIEITDSEGTVLLKTRTLNISDGGALLEPHEDTIEIGAPVDVTMNVPRSTANTFMFEQVSSSAHIIRGQQAEHLESLALMFIEPLKLSLEEEPGTGSRGPGE
jgi:hypothetical protein